MKKKGSSDHLAQWLSNYAPGSPFKGREEGKRVELNLTPTFSEGNHPLMCFMY